MRLENERGSAANILSYLRKHNGSKAFWDDKILLENLGILIARLCFQAINLSK